MLLRKLILGALLMATSVTFAQQASPQLPLDPDVRMGKLDNGLTYYIRHNNWPEHRVNFYIAQKVGAIQEEENQRGLAHFLEHMAFNGSDHFKGNDLIEWCRSKGIEFGGDLNAYTGIDQTVYNIDNVPSQNAGTVDSCLLILRDWSTGLTLDPKEIDKERGVIHEEWRMRTSAFMRMYERNLPTLYPGSKYGVRFPIGLMSVVDNFKPQELVDYYHKWYHPSHQGIIVVGDIDVDAIEAKIKKLFGNIKNPVNEAPIVKEAVPDNDKPIIVVDKDKEFQQSFVMLMMKQDTYPDSLKQQPEYLAQSYVISIAMDMLNNRLLEAAQKADCPYGSANVEYGPYLFASTKDATALTIRPKDMSLSAKSLQSAVVELLRASRFGFTQTEYDRARQNMMSMLDKAYSNKDKRYNTEFYEQYKGHFLSNEPATGIEYNYQLMKAMVPQIPLQVVNETMKQLVSENDTNLVIISFNNEKDGAVYPTKENLLDAVHRARAEQITAYVDNVKNEPLIAKLPAPGKIVKEEKNEKFGYTKLTLSNGATVLLKKTDFKKDVVSLTGEGGGGSALYDKADKANILVFDDVIAHSGLGNFSSTELQKALAGKIANADLTMNELKMGINGSSTPKDVETMLQMTYLYFTNIKKDNDAYNTLMSQLKTTLANRALSPDVALGDSVQTTLYGYTWRKQPLVSADLPNVSYDRILQMAKERTATAKGWLFEIIGNYDEATIRPLICQYLASLPAKQKPVVAKRQILPREKSYSNVFERKMETPKSTAYMLWLNTTMPYTLENSIKMDMAGQILSMVYLQKIREDAGAAYSCGAVGSARLDDDGVRVMRLIGFCPMKPEKQELARSIMKNATEELAEKCDKEMLEKVQQLMIKQYEDAQKTNSYWLAVMDKAYKFGLDMHTDTKRLIQAQTPESISAFMKALLKDSRQFTTVMLPAGEQK